MRTQYIKFVLSENEKTAIRQMAEKEKMNMSEFIKMLIALWENKNGNWMGGENAGR